MLNSNIVSLSSFWLLFLFEEKVTPAFNKNLSLSCLFPLLLHQELVRDEGDEFPIGGLVVLAVDVVAEEGVEVLAAWATPRPKRLSGSS